MNKFLIGLVIGIAIAGGLAVYLNNTPTQFTSKGLINSGTSHENSRMIILAPSTKIKEVANENNDASSPANYDFYDVLQSKKALSSAIVVKNEASEPQKLVGTDLVIQVGAFSNEKLAVDMKGQLTLLGISSTIKSQQDRSGKPIHRVLVGPVANDIEAKKIINQLSEQKINAVIIRVTK